MMDLEAMFSDVPKEDTQKSVSQVPTPPTPPAPPVPPAPPTQSAVPQPPVAPSVPETPVVQEVPVVQPVPQAPVMQAPVVPQPQQNHSVLSNSSAPSTLQSNNIVRDKVDDNFTITVPESLKATLIEAGADIGDIGMRVSRVPIEKYKASASKIDRIGFVWTKVIPIKMHFIEGKGSIMCFHGKCCELQGSPQVRYLFPIVVYQTDSEGNVSGGKVSLMILSAGEDLYRTIQTLHKGSAAFGGLDRVDLLVTCTDEKYQKLSLVQAGPAIWREYRQIADFINNKMQKDIDKAYMAVARKVDESSFLKMVDMAIEENQPPQADTIANQDLSKFFS